MSHWSKRTITSAAFDNHLARFLGYLMMGICSVLVVLFLLIVPDAGLVRQIFLPCSIMVGWLVLLWLPR
jgi:hypothetical protein